MTGINERPLLWMGSSKGYLQAMPAAVQDVFGFALYQAQNGGKHPQAKALKGFSGAGVLEVVEDFNGNAYRAIYTVRFESNLYVLHCFQKKSNKGIETPKHELDTLKLRLKAAQHHAQGANT